MVLSDGCDTSCSYSVYEVVGDCKSDAELKISSLVLFSTAFCISMPLILRKAYLNPTRIITWLGSTFGVILAVFDFTSDIALGITYALRSKNHAICPMERRRFSFDAILVFGFVGTQIILSTTLVTGYFLYFKIWKSFCSLRVFAGIAGTAVLTHFAVWAYAIALSRDCKLEFHVGSIWLEPVLPAFVSIAVLLAMVCSVSVFTFSKLWNEMTGGDYSLVRRAIGFLGFLIVWPFSSLSYGIGTANAEDSLSVVSLMLEDINGDDADPIGDKAFITQARYLFALQCIEGLPLTIIQVSVLLRIRDTCLEVSWLEYLSITVSASALVLHFICKWFFAHTPGSAFTAVSLHYLKKIFKKDKTSEVPAERVPDPWHDGLPQEGSIALQASMQSVRS